MKKINKHYLLFFLLFFLFLIYFLYIQLRLHLLSAPLNKFMVKNLEIEGSEGRFDIFNKDIFYQGKKVSKFTKDAIYGKAFSLGIFYKITKEDPLFVSPELDELEFANSILHLKSIQDEFKRKIELDSDIVPVNFLQTLPEIKKNHQFFIDNPSLLSAEKLIASYKEAQRRYKEEIITLKNSVEKYFPTEKEQVFMQLATATSNRIIISDLNVMLENAQELEEEIIKREKIIYNKGKYNMSRNNLTLAKLSLVEPPNNLLGKDELFIEEQDMGKRRGPYQIKTQCFAGYDNEEYLYISLYGNRILPFFVVKSATDIYYERITTSNELYKSLLADGYEWIAIARDGSNYRCNNTAYITTVVMLDHFSSQYRDDLIFKSISESNYFDQVDKMTKQIVKRGVEAENRFFSSEISAEKNLFALAGYYLAAYNELNYTQDNNARNNHKDELLKRYLLINNQMAGIQNIFNSTLYLDNLQNNLELNPTRINTKANGYLYTIRSSYSLSFFNFAPSVWRLSKKPTYIKEENNIIKQGANQRITTYSELLKGYDKKIILSWPKTDDEERFRSYGQKNQLFNGLAH